MALKYRIVVLGAATTNKDGTPSYQAVIPLTDGSDDVEPFGELISIQSLGLSAMPWPADKAGHAEGVALVEGSHDVIVGARDTRCDGIKGKQRPGDTFLYSTGPQQCAQIQLKEDKRQCVLATKDSRGKDMLAILDGKNDKVTITAFGQMFELSPDGANITAGGCTLLMQDGTFYFLGKAHFGGMTPSPMKVMLAPGPSPGGPASIPLTPAPGISIGL